MVFILTRIHVFSMTPQICFIQRSNYREFRRYFFSKLVNFTQSNIDFLVSLLILTLIDLILSDPLCESIFEILNSTRSSYFPFSTDYR